MEKNILNPLAVIPIPQSSVDVTEHQNYPNSEMVYAVDALGNQVAVGYFVTESFRNPDESNENIKLEGSVENDASDFVPESNWVAALEECETEHEKCQKTENNDSKEVIKIYKSRKVKNKHVKRNNPNVDPVRKTLKQMRKVKSQQSSRSKNMQAFKVQLRGDKNLNILNKMNLRKRKKISDKAFPKPSSIRNVNFQS